MRYTTFPPPASLAPYVRFFWVLESKVAPGETYLHQSMADGCAEMIFHYRGRFDEFLSDNRTQKSFTSGIHGQAQHCSRFVIDRSFGIFGVYLYPFAIPVLFGFPSTEMSNQMADLDTLFGQEGKDLEEQVMLATSDEERICLLSRFLEKRLKKRQEVSAGLIPAIHEIIRTRGMLPVKEMAQKHFLSVRQFERKFKETAGFSPKLYSRIIRFQSAVSEYPVRQKSLTEIALNCGYYDQSHFIHDFKKFSGHHPKAFFSGKAEGMGWMGG